MILFTYSSANWYWNGHNNYRILADQFLEKASNYVYPISTNRIGWNYKLETDNGSLPTSAEKCTVIDTQLN